MNSFPCQLQDCTSDKSDWFFSNEAHDFLYASRNDFAFFKCDQSAIFLWHETIHVHV